MNVLTAFYFSRSTWQKNGIIKAADEPHLLKKIKLSPMVTDWESEVL